MYKHIAIDNVTHDTLKRIARENGRSIVGQLRIMVDKYEAQKNAQDASSSVTSVTPVATPTGKPQTETDKRIAELSAKLGAIDKDIELHGGEEPPEYFEMFNEVVELQKKQQLERGLTPKV